LTAVLQPVSRLFTFWHIGNNELARLFVTNAFVEPMAVIPDIGGPPANGYFAVKSRAEWRKYFVRWLRSPHLAMVLKGQAPAAYNNAQRNQHEFLWETARVAARDASAGGGG